MGPLLVSFPLLLFTWATRVWVKLKVRDGLGDLGIACTVNIMPVCEREAILGTIYRKVVSNIIYVSHFEIRV